MTPDEMRELTEQARRVKRALDGEPLGQIYGTKNQDHQISRGYADRNALTRFAVNFLTGPARIEWAKVVRDAKGLYGIGGAASKSLTCDNVKAFNRLSGSAIDIKDSLTDLAAILTAGLEGTT